MVRPLVFAHRGASHYAPENTFASYKMAVDMNADGIEIDVHKSKDGHLIVCHDEKVDRTTNGTGYIKDLNLKEIKSLDAGSWFDKKFAKENIPTLNEVLKFVKRENILLNIELKNGPIFYPNIEEDIVELIKYYGLESYVIISSFNHYSLLKIKKIEPKIKTGILYIAGMVSPWKYAKSIGADAIHPLFITINEQVVKECLFNKVMVNPFTVNNEDEIILMKMLNVTSIITDRPDIGIKVVSSI
ncbi:glycerophosphodiester phosphodiesterase [Anaerosalibacter massiliensis]|uniref:Glycerophosphodiester phosphodiesterase n=1 Tax=Anaerosalibacter massiliensis TaxID=1347392 RepID=A0A9X2S5Z1_9FIRM|nr:glycerophosphodiester phosphodiesterase [Anaerosalibacter massiliensis]MCR2043082.1 glycerophosphodiester phosphodiesterase [Anaerosalibacter massiliensis]